MWRICVLISALAIANGACCKGWERRKGDRQDASTTEYWGCSLCNCKDIDDKNTAFTQACQAKIPEISPENPGRCCVDLNATDNWGCQSCNCNDRSDEVTSISTNCNKPVNKICDQQKVLNCTLSSTVFPSQNASLAESCAFINTYAICANANSCASGSMVMQQITNAKLGCPEASEAPTVQSETPAVQSEAPTVQSEEQPSSALVATVPVASFIAVVLAWFQ